MICQQCGKKPATNHYKTTVNGQTAIRHLCESCAAAGMSGLDIGSFWGGLFGMSVPQGREATKEIRCEGCGHTFRELAASGKTGCAECYTTFYKQLLPSIQRIHGMTAHAAKTGREEPEKMKRAQELARLREQLAKEIEAQQFEACAALRDKIKELEGEA